MRLDDLKEAKGRRPFEAFDIHLADGRAIPIGHPDAIAWQGPDFAPVLHVVLADGRWEVVNFAAITSLRAAAATGGPVPEASGNGA
jgi:hypothetical protein